jgi:RNA polymerase sigma-70 factor, ECF subfamily
VRSAPQTPPRDERTDDELMKRAADGDSAAFAALVRRHHERLRAFCSRWCASAGAGDDVAQECFVEVWRRRALYEPQGKFKEYLFRVAANRCKNQRRAQARRLGVTTAAVPEPSADDSDRGSERLVQGERQRRMQLGLSKLPELQREAVLLRYSAELAYADIATLLEAPEATVRSRVFLGLAKLRRLLRVEKKP